MAVRLPPCGAGPRLALAGCPGLALLRLGACRVEAGPRSRRSGSGLEELLLSLFWRRSPLACSWGGSLRSVIATPWVPRRWFCALGHSLFPL
eukprot:9358633-Alexandrium_andersonii.AAC.1